MEAKPVHSRPAGPSILETAAHIYKGSLVSPHTFIVVYNPM